MTTPNEERSGRGMLKISIAMTTYNGARFLREQLDSLKNQIRAADEVVICDDNSTDDTVLLIRNYIEKNNLSNWKIFENEENIGFSANFCKALSKTTGDVVFLCDQDDVWSEDKLECMTNLFATHPRVLGINTSFEIIGSGGEVTDAYGARGNRNYGLVTQRLRRPLERIYLKTVMRKNISPGCTTAFRRELIDCYVQNTESVSPHDYELNLMAAAKKGLYFYNVPLIQYRIHESNTIGFKKIEKSRIEIAAERFSASKGVRAFSGNGMAYKVHAERIQALTTRNFWAALCLWRLPEYYAYFRFKERVGDLLYALKIRE